ncbi:MAG: antitoxin Xre-like helix-turn-helix domain-containing protein [Dissulfurispiraceae bacterium]
MSAATVNVEIINVLGVKGKTSVNFDSIIRKGFSIEALERFKKTFQMDEETLARSIGVSRKTLQRKRKKSARQKLNVEESNRLFRMVRILTMATETFGGDKKVATEWMQEPQYGLGGMTPLKMLETDAGTEKVESLLLHLQYGGVA